MLAVLAIVAGCGGPSADEWRAAQHDVARLKADLDVANKRHADDEQKYEDAMAKVADLKAALGNLGTMPKPEATHPQTAPEPPLASPVPIGWRQIANDEVIGEPGCILTLFVSFEGADAVAAARSDETVRTAFVRLDFAPRRACKKQKNKSTTLHARFGCNSPTQKTLGQQTVDWNDATSGTDFTEQTAPVATVYPDTFVHEAWKYVCGHH